MQQVEQLCFTNRL